MNKKIWKIYNNQRKKEINKLKRILNYPFICEICNTDCFGAEAHHIDGDIRFNTRDNILFVCKRCHNIIHHGFSWLNDNSLSNDFNTMKKVIIKLSEYRDKWIHHDRNYQVPKYDGLIL